MRLQRRTLALVSATVALTSTAVFAATGPAGADPRPSHNPGMERMHELMREGNPGMMRTHERMMTSSGMRGMHSH